MTTLIALAAVLQDSPIEVPKNEWPAKAECVSCVASGNGHGEEKPVAALRYKGQTFYFCNKKEPVEFKKDPDSFLPPVLPRPAPKFTLKDTAGNIWDNQAFSDKLLLVDFWATWCGPCKKVMPILKDVRARYREKGLEVLSVSIDEKPEELTKFLTKNPMANPVLHDNAETWLNWKVKVVPTLFLVKNGQIVDQWSGLVTKDQLDSSIEKALKQS